MLNTFVHIDAVAERLAPMEGSVARIARDLITRIREITVAERSLARDITKLTNVQAPTLLAVPGVGALTAAKIIGEVADITRFKSKDAFARHNGTAPLPAWSSDHPRHRLARTGNRQLNAAIHRVALTQARCDPRARDYLDKRRSMGDTPNEARRVLKRRLSDVIYRALLTDALDQLLAA